jgi:Asp-tRNA(Asn)/Glu-tRNA(Gln) amidotransferase A subunit family amidase
MPEEESYLQTFDYLSAQIGVASLLLGAVGLLLAFLAIPIFVYLKYRAEKVAREATEAALQGAVERIEKRAIEAVEALLPRLTAEYLDLVRNSVSDEVANEIAAAQENDNVDRGRHSKSPD